MITPTQNRVKKSTRVEKLAKVAKDNAWALAVLAAKGNEDAAVELYRTAASTTQPLTDLCGLKPELFNTIAEKRFSWPLMYNPHRESMEEDAKFIKKIKARQTIATSGKNFLDYVTRRFNASSAGLKKPVGLNLRWDTV